MVQVSFTLPMPFGTEDERGLARAAAVDLSTNMGLTDVMVVHGRAIGQGFAFFIVYGRASHVINVKGLRVPKRDYPLLSAKEVNLSIRETLNRKMVVLGACIGTDAHTVAIDAILNAKGFGGEKGLESYREMSVSNLGAQVLVPDLIAAALTAKADAVLVSQVVTQREVHIKNVREMVAAFNEAYPAGQKPVLVVGGPRFDPRMAGDLGVDRVYGKETRIQDVASFLAFAIASRT
jgi:beta-lysine 5,6-aminomutase beta subunit